MPLIRLKFLLLGVFCLTGMVGCLLDVVALGFKPFADVIVWTVFTGFMAVIYVLLALRDPRWLPAGVVLHIVGSMMVHSFFHRINAFLPHPDMQTGVRFAAISSIVLCFLSSVFFLLFFYREGRYSVRLQTELQLAHDMQKTLVPVVNLCSEQWEIYGVSQPSENVGGDLVDVISQPDGSLLAYLTDISGHGLPASILMGRFKTAARTCALENLSLSSFLERLNRVLPQVKEPEMFATCAAVRLPALSEASTKCLEIAIAGHPEPALFSSRLASATRIDGGSAALGLLPSPQFPSIQCVVSSGDVLLIFTDGLTEITNAHGKEFCWDRLRAVVERGHAGSLKSISDAIFEEGVHWGTPVDDRTLLLIRAR